MKNYYHRLEDKFYFFSVLLHTQNERVFKKCYELLTGEKEKKDSVLGQQVGTPRVCGGAPCLGLW